MLHSLLQGSVRCSCHIWLLDMMDFSSREANLGGGLGISVGPILLFSLSKRSPDRIEILLTGTLSKPQLNQQAFNRNKTFPFIIYILDHSYKTPIAKLRLVVSKN